LAEVLTPEPLHYSADTKFKVPPFRKYLFAPGPTPVPPEVALEMARPIIHHRTPEFSAVLDQARERLKPLIGTREEVLLLSSSGTGAMEAAVANLLNPGDAAVYVNAGKFGERWGRILSAFGMTGHEVTVPWGNAVAPEQIEGALRDHPGARAVLMQASETSTTAVHPVDRVAEITRQRDAMLIVDGITSVGVFEQKMDEWGVDALVTGSQKALMLPPGLGIVALSPRAWARAAKVHSPRFYFDLKRELKAQRDDHTTAYTPAISLIFGLNKSLEMIHAETLPVVFGRHRLMARAARAAAAALKLKLLAPENPAPGVTGMLVPDRIDGSALVRYMRDVIGVTVQGGQDQMKGRLVRIGHMGYMAPLDMLVAVGALEMALQRQGYDFHGGGGVAAAQAEIASGA
jgi:aspartate aminotransferase-like enzyme